MLQCLLLLCVYKTTTLYTCIRTWQSVKRKYFLKIVPAPGPLRYLSALILLCKHVSSSEIAFVC